MQNLENLEKYLNSELTTKLNSSLINHKQLKIVINSSDLIDVLVFIKNNQNTKFKQLIDITAVDFPEKEQRFKMIYFF